MIRLLEVNEENFEEVIGLSLAPSQEKFVASNVRSLAQCYIYREDGDVFPMAVVHEDRTVGFLLLEKDFEEGFYLVWRMMIDRKEQRKGFGEEVLREVLRQAKEALGIDAVRADYVKGNEAMAHLLSKLGFVRIGEEEREILNEYRLRL